jgi:hypothetical protein
VTREAQFRIISRWSPPPKEGEKDVADIGMHVGRNVLTQLLDMDTQQMRDHFRASAVSLAIWFADNWWRLRWEPIQDYRSNSADWRLRHELTSASGGTAWPPLMIYGVGERVVVSPISIGADFGGPVQYRSIPVNIVSARDYEQGLDSFFSNVLSACEKARDGKALRVIIDQLNDERKDPEEAGWRRLEARLGFDPDEAPEGLIESLIEQEARIGPEAVEEAAVGHPGSEAPHALQQAIAASQTSALVVDLESVGKVEELSDQPDVNRPIWMIAEDAAAQLRQALGRHKGPLRNKAFSEIFSASWTDLIKADPTASKLAYGARLKESETKERLALQTRNGRDRRFELARVIGDVVWKKSGRFGVISHAKTDRQKFQRAFAQSLLCPFEDLRHYVDLSGPSEEQIEAAAQRYHVHKNVVRTLLVNKGLLPRETLEERLEAV